MNLDYYSNIENGSIDFKQEVERKKSKSWLKTISAFANGDGGVLIFGLGDNKEHIGLLDVKSDSEYITSAINSKIEPLPRYEIICICENDKNFLIVDVGDGPKTPYYYVNEKNKTAYYRSGSDTVEASKIVLDNLILKGENTTFDELPSKYKIDDLSFTLLSSSLKKETGSGLNVDKDYKPLNIVSYNNLVTNAGVLLCDQSLFSHSRVICTRWNGNLKASVYDDVLDDKEYTGSIISLLESAELFVKNNTKVSWGIVGMKRVEVEDYPLKGIREALVNAIIHRDYQIVGSEIHLDIYDNRLEVTSPGGMFDGSNVQNLDITKIYSMRRNRIISDVFNRLHYMDRRGSGLTRIIESYKNHNEKPTFYSSSSSFIVSFPNMRYLKEEINVVEPKVNVNEQFILSAYRKLLSKVRADFIENLETLLLKFSNDKSFGRKDIEEIYDVKKSRAVEIIKILINHELVIVESEGVYKLNF